MGQAIWIIAAEAVYIIVLIAVCLRIVWDTQSVSKTLAYLLLVIFVPVFGVFFYFSFGVNYRKRKIYNKKLRSDGSLAEEYRREIDAETAELMRSQNSSIVQFMPLIRMLTNPNSESFNPVLYENKVDILVNGEAFFPVLLEKLKKAEKHIHFEFYIYENDSIGNAIKQILIEKARQGVEVRFIYDDFGSKGIRRSFVRELNRNGVKAYPFNRIRLVALANRLNYRNHRKIVVIDGETSFVGGINVSDKYINDGSGGLFWRDTQLMVAGYATHLLQYIFLSDWNFCSGENLAVNHSYFPKLKPADGWDSSVQIISCGPDSEVPSILHSVLQSINLAKEEVLLTTPYYIPDENLQQALILKALSGLDIKLLVPKKGDSMIVNLASQAYYEDLLKAGVRIFRYTKGFVHAKTVVADRKLASVGTANLDLRSFDLNFEVSALVYDERKASELADVFMEDLKGSEELSLDQWHGRSRMVKIAERLLRLLSPFM